MRWITVLLLAVLIAGGWVGGISFLSDPSGSGLGMTTDQLPPWPLLDDYAIPGLLLLIGFGLLPVPAAVLLAHRNVAGFRAAAGVGVLLVIWMLAQFAAIGVLLPGMQFGFLAVGGALVALGVRGAALSRDGGAGVGDGRASRPNGRST